MDLNRLTKHQLVRRLRAEEKRSCQLEVDLEDSRRRAGEEQDNAIQAVQLAQRAHRTVETFRYLLEDQDRAVGRLTAALEQTSHLHQSASQAARVRGRVIENLKKLSGPVVICPSCGDVQQAPENDVLLCDSCLSQKAHPFRQGD